MLDFIEDLLPEQREGGAEALRNPLDFITGDFDRVLAILKHVNAERLKGNLSADGA